MSWPFLVYERHFGTVGTPNIADTNPNSTHRVVYATYKGGIAAVGGLETR